MSLRARGAALALLAAAATACATLRPSRAPELEPDRWLEFRTPQFELLTNAGRDRGRRMADQLLVFNAVVTRSMAIGEVTPRLPLRIYVFREEAQFALVRSIRRAAGEHAATLTGSVITLSATRPASAREVLYHEYVHFLLHNGALDYPLWYNEGLAELLATTTVREGFAFIGAAPAGTAVGLARHLPLDELLSRATTRQMSPSESLRFYAHAWLLTHFLHTGSQAGEPDRFPQMLRYLELLNRGTGWEAAVDSAFGVPLAELDAAFDAYRQRLLRSEVGRDLVIRAPAEAEEPVVRPVPPHEMAYRLVELTGRAGHRGLAADLLEYALAVAPGDPRALALLAAYHAADGEFAESARAIERAQAGAPDDPVVQLAAGDVAMLQAARASDGAERAMHIDRARRAYRRGAELAPEVPEGHAKLGFTYVGREDDADAGIEALERARALAPWLGVIHLGLGRLYVQADQPERARESLRRVISLAHGAESARQAQEILDGLGDRDEPVD